MSPPANVARRCLPRRRRRRRRRRRPTGIKKERRRALSFLGAFQSSESVEREAAVVRARVNSRRYRVKRRRLFDEL